MSNGILGAIGAYVKGGDATPYRIISAEMTGANELFWWVKADSPIKTPEGRRRQDHRVLVAGLVVEPDPADAAQAGRLQGQARADRRRARDLHPDHDRPDRHRLVGGAVRAEGRQRRQDPHRRPLAARRPSLPTRPSAPTSPTSIRSRPSARRSPSSCRSIHKSIDWAYSNPQAIEIFAKNMKVTPEIAKQAVDEFYPEVGHADRRDPRPRSLAAGCARLQVHRRRRRRRRTSPACSTSSTSRNEMTAKPSLWLA